MRRNLCVIGCLWLLSAVTLGEPSSEQLYFAQFGGGGGLRSDLVLTNPSPHSRVSGRVEFFAEDGSPLEVKLESVAEPISQVEYNIGPLGAVTLSALPDGELRAGAAVASADGSLSGVIRFQIPGIGVAGVGVSHPSTAFIMPARLVAGGISTGVAVHNATADPVDLSLNLRDGKGKLLASSEIEGFPGRGHLARYVGQLFPEAELPVPNRNSPNRCLRSRLDSMACAAI